MQHTIENLNIDV